jgi:hypothetical protein
MGASAVAIWCLAVASAAPSVGYLRLPVTGHLEALSIANLPGIPIMGYRSVLSKTSCVNFSSANKFTGHEIKRAIILRSAVFACLRYYLGVIPASVGDRP